MNDYDTWDEYYLATGHQKPKTAGRKIYWDAKNQCYRKRKEYKMATTFTIKKRENSPGFVFGSFGCKLDDLKDFVNDKGYVNFDILATKDNTGYYVKVSDFGINKKTDSQVMEFDEEKMPF